MGCEDCIHCKYIPMVVRGSMDCDPPEYYCEKGEDDWFLFDENDKDQMDYMMENYTEEEIEYGCPKWRADPDE